MIDVDFERFVEEVGNRHFGKYRGTVVDNADPDNRGAVQVQVPAVHGQVAVWAMPCTPYAGSKVGLFAIPPKNASVWVEFEAGRRDHPIWTGCFWAKGEIDAADAAPDIVFLKTPGATIRIEDSGTIEIETQGGAKITMTGTEITLEAQSIKQSASGGTTALSASGFDAMNGALTVI